MPQRYVDAIIKYLANRDYQPLKPRQLARQMGVSDEEYDSFRAAIKVLHESGRLVQGAKQCLVLPEPAGRFLGTFRATARGFGFVTPETPNSHGDLYIPAGAGAGAMNGDQVQAEVTRRGRREGGQFYEGRVVEIVTRATRAVVGTLRQTDQAWVVLPDGRAPAAPVVVSDVGPGTRDGQKVVAEIVTYGRPGELARGVITENLGASGQIQTETKAIIRARALPEEFPADVLHQARAATEQFDARKTTGREDLSSQTIVTIDPDDARDFDDAISLTRHGQEWHLGVHIADVSHFVTEGSALDVEARTRGNSVYFPRRVVPMLPEVLSNGVCSLQEDQPRFCLSAFVRYDAQGNVLGRRLARTVIRSAKRLTYTQAQAIIDGQAGGHDHKVVGLCQRMNELARLIERRRETAGMLHLDLPAVELVLDDHGRVTDAVPEDQSYTHTIIEMFMVEANEAVASMLDAVDVPFLRRIHPDPDVASKQRLGVFTRVCGHKLPRDLTRHDLQKLLKAVKGRPESHAVNLAVLKSFESAEYSPASVGHFALASRHYCHFTSPIRRYPDLTIHRLVTELAANRPLPAVDVPALVALGQHCSMTERRAQSAEDELRTLLVLQLLAGKVGQAFDGVVTGVTNFGCFVQLNQLLVDGLIRMEDLGDDWWNVSIEHGEVRGERSGRRYRIGDPLAVQILSVNLPARQLNLSPLRQRAAGAGTAVPGKPSPGKAAKPPRGKAPQAKGAPAAMPPRKKRKGRPGRRERQHRKQEPQK